MMKTKSPISYFGSDASVARELGKLLDAAKHVTIPFAGGMSILPCLKARAVVANDLHRHAIRFYRTLKGPRRDELIARCRDTLSHPEELAHATWLVSIEAADDVQFAWAWWAQCWIGRKGKAGTKHTGGMPSVRRTAVGGTNATRIQAAADDLTEWAKHFQRCEFECLDFREVLSKCADIPYCGIYCDPPWFGAGRNYLHEFNEDDHSDLEAMLRRFKSATVVVRYGDCATVRDLYCHANWSFVTATSRTQANKETSEVWIVNVPESF